MGDVLVLQMLEMKAFEEINTLHPIERMTMSTNYGAHSGAQHSQSGQGWLRKVFKWKRSVSHI